jgi:hypothetical protein
MSSIADRQIPQQPQGESAVSDEEVSPVTLRGHRIVWRVKPQEFAEAGSVQEVAFVSIGPAGLNCVSPVTRNRQWRVT